AIAHAAPGGKLKHLVMSGHANPGYLQVGQGFDVSNIPLFSAWTDLIEKIWLPNCLIAHMGMRDGNAFVSRLAKPVRCDVVASTELQCEFTRDVPPDMMTSFEGLVLSYGPKGNVTWSSRNRSMWNRTDPATGAQLCVPVPD